ncbi:STAS/SEC14 domain-containing protein [Aquimarina sp. Aq107]|uniref:STAS/SEC14 domain-containing protein n=1 Tax=Aquimarina sp. Aq107 TaxID=1191912 RepID=UPI000D55838F|nr:STAS/SEC14 domain-containing protein [Aquimarina sp. Aq107]
MSKHYDLGFALVEIREDYLKNTISEGFLVMPKHNKLLLEFVTKYFKDKPFVYISNRVNTYAVDPTVYHETTKIDTLVGIAVVSKNHRQKKLTELESKFFEKKLKYFSSISEALEWKNEILKKE